MKTIKAYAVVIRYDSEETKILNVFTDRDQAEQFLDKTKEDLSGHEDIPLYYWKNLYDQFYSDYYEKEFRKSCKEHGMPTNYESLTSEQRTIWFKIGDELSRKDNAWCRNKAIEEGKYTPEQFDNTLKYHEFNEISEMSIEETNLTLDDNFDMNK